MLTKKKTNQFNAGSKIFFLGQIGVKASTQSTTEVFSLQYFNEGTQSRSVRNLHA